MTKAINLADKIEKKLPEELVAFIHKAREVAAGRREQLYIVGGVVRDLLLGQTNLDLDLVVEGNAIELAQRLAEIKQGKITTHTRFNTAKIQWDKWSVDLATARSETYEKPGALPKVKPSSINNDLFRRDFTINAMAVYLDPKCYGELLDPYRGKDDLESKLIRILHEKSFIDDATRIWRGLRYEQRLDFRLEETTIRLLKRDIRMLDTISADRIRYEIECILQEKYPEKVFRRADELGVLPKLHPALKGDGWLAGKFEEARRIYQPDSPPMSVYLALFVYRLNKKETDDWISYFRWPKSMAKTIHDTASLKNKFSSLAKPNIKPSRIFYLLNEYSTPAIRANSIACESATARQHIQLFLDKLRYVKPILTGEDLKRLGVANGRNVGTLLQQIHEAKLDGEIATKKDEEEFVTKTAKCWQR
ncbi:MAG: CCA tRNA nucleotidyltransferase [Chloroflexi bacterium]|nr:CCA tRNA nucleotidyltransferase [Chloroflexota bacterium]